MTNQISGNAGRGLVQRIKSLLLRPREEWQVIAREPISSGDLFTSYALPLAAIGPVATFLGSQIFGYDAGAMTYRPSLLGSLGQAIASYIQALAGLFAVSFIANKLAPTFAGEASTRNAFKLVVHASTAAWIAGIVTLIPSFTPLALLGLYSAYLLYTGATPIMKVPPEKAATFTVVTIVAAILAFICLAVLIGQVGRLVGGPGWGAVSGGRITSADGERIAIPDFDPSKLEEAARDVEKAAKNRDLIAPADLKALLPERIGAYQRGDIESKRAGPVSNAEATYEAGGKSFTLKVADMGVIGAVASLAGTVGVESSKESRDGYERTTTKDGNLIVEEWDGDRARGKYMTMAGKRYMIEAQGDANGIDELKAAVATIDQGKLVALGK